jgi:diadenosine tetraphosphate (Ap4A) HIT family hydrolase
MDTRSCELCQQQGGTLIAAHASWRVVRVDDVDFPAFYRVIWRAHLGEMTELEPGERNQLLAAVFAVEGALRQALQPDKINLASLGNMVPHLHWHVVARFRWDSHFPQPIWGARQRTVHPVACDRLRVSLVELDRLVATALVPLVLQPPGEGGTVARYP